MNKVFKQIHKTRASDEVRGQIIELIRNGTFRIGDQLPSETELASDMGLSQAPVREAVKSLEHMGLIDVKRGAGGGLFVAEPSLEPFSQLFSLLLIMGRASVQELTEARLLLEPAVAAMAAQNIGSSQLDELRAVNRGYENAVRANRPRALADMDFHLLLARASGNQVLDMMMRALVPLLYRTARDHRFEHELRLKGIREHWAVFEAVEAGQPESARKAMSEHVRRMATYWS